MQTIRIRDAVVEFEYTTHDEFRVHSIEIDGRRLIGKPSTAAYLACLKGEAFFRLLKILDEHCGPPDDAIPKIDALPSCTFDDPCGD